MSCLIVIELKNYQKKAVELLSQRRALAIFYEQGLGKTRIILEEIKKSIPFFTLIICPKSLIPTWKDQVEQWLPPFYQVNTITKEHQFQQGKHQINLVSVDFFSRKKSLDKLKIFLKEEDTYIVIDESSTIKNQKSARAKNILKIFKSCQGKKRILNGTPITQSPFDLYSQMSFICENIFEQKSFWAFKNYYGEMQFRHLSPFTGFNELIRYRNIEELMIRTKEYSIFLNKKDAKLELPDKIFQKILITLEGNQLSMYKKLLKDCIVECNSNSEILITQALTKITKLRQILSGFVYLTDGAVLFSHNNVKIKTLLDIMDFNSGKNILIWCIFQQEAKMISEALNKKKINNIAIYSDIPIEQVNDYISGKVNTLIITQKKGSRGLTLINTSLVIFFSNSYSISERLQAEDRCHRIGLNHTVLYYDLVISKTIDEKLHESLVEKKIFNATLMEWLQEDLTT